MIRANIHIHTDTARLHREGPNRWHLLYVDTCEACGVECQGPNGFRTDDAGARTLQAAGVRVIEEEPRDELGHSDELGLAVCGECYEEARR